MANASILDAPYLDDLPSRDELIRLVYKGALEPVPFRAFLRTLADRVDCLNAGIILRLSQQGTPPIAIWARKTGLSDDEARRIHEVHASVGHLDPLRNVLAKKGAIQTLDEVMPRAEIEQNRFYREVLAPYGFFRMLGMYVQ